uniref:GAG-pre-integrase domain-containing protein n=1 Tax=Triticum urartu TaxID=4572 RepID=A0A8R7VEI0_TRIUA
LCRLRRGTKPAWSPPCRPCPRSSPGSGTSTPAPRHTSQGTQDPATRTPLMSSSSYGQLYSLSGGLTTTPAALSVSTSYLWHRRLGHPSAASLSRLANNFLPTCNKTHHP